MKKKTLTAIIILGLLTAGFVYAKLPAQISGIVRTKIFECMLQRPYQYMFEPTLPIKKGKKHPKELTEYRGGMQGILFYADLVKCIGGKGKTWGDLAPLEQALGMKAIRSGKTGWLGTYYRPEIINWAVNNLIPNPKAKLKGMSYQQIYNKTMRRFFRVMAATYRHLHAKPGRLQADTEFYRSIVGNYNTFWDALYSQYSEILPELKIPRDESQLTVPVAAAFWIRRHADGTAAALWRGNKKVLQLYDKEWFAAQGLAGLK